MKITLNGQHKEFNNIANVQDLVTQVCQHTNHIITEINGDIVKLEQRVSTLIKE
ncbi:hypothetical protein MNBD_UNCLBAC01-951, partial [hydrothermal vent metagenome]